MPEVTCTLCGMKKHITPSDWRQNKTKIFFCCREHSRVYRKGHAHKVKGNIAAVVQG